MEVVNFSEVQIKQRQKWDFQIFRFELKVQEILIDFWKLHRKRLNFWSSAAFDLRLFYMSYFFKLHKMGENN